ncbi:MAG: hypothetical protein JRN52_03700 [Nitrososphaerota archaeon]|nr:hypothetical protein [Nitrososphaerota archaeon]
MMIRTDFQTRRRKNAYLIAAILVASSLAAVTAAYAVGVTSVSADSSATITAYRVSGNGNLQSPGSESFWSSIPWASVPLSANVPNGGKTAAINVKAAWNGTQIFVLLDWNATAPSNRMSSVFSLGGGPAGFPPIWYNQSSGQYVAAPPRSDEGTIVHSYYVNSTYYSQDRVAMMWYLGGQSGTTPSDCMVVGQSNGGAMQAGGAADIWDFMNGASWNSSSQFVPQQGSSAVSLSKYYDWWNKNVSFTGVDYRAPPTGFAINLYSNASNLYEVGLGTGLFYDDAGTNSTNPYSTAAGAAMGSGSWTVEMSRTLSMPSGGSPYLVNLSSGNTYDVAFAVWQGAAGENAFIKSISTFVTLNISNQSPTTTAPAVSSTSASTATVTTTAVSTTTVTGTMPQSAVSTSVAVVVALGTLIVGLVVGYLVRKPKQQVRPI